MEFKEESTSTQLKKCVHGRMIENHLLKTQDISLLFVGNIFLKQHVKKCQSCQNEIEKGQRFWEAKERILESRQLAPRQRELFMSEVDQLFLEFEKKVKGAEELAVDLDKVRAYFYKLSLELVSPGMIALYLMILISSFGIYLFV